jgi:hypothetical protein
MRRPVAALATGGARSHNGARPQRGRRWGRSSVLAGSAGFALSCLLCFGEVEGASGRNIEETASWRVALFFVVFLVLSLVLEQFFHALEHCLHHIGQVGLEEAVHKIKEELMLMGFISLMLIALEENIVRLCVEPKVTPEGIFCCSVSVENSSHYTARAEECCGLGYGDAGYVSGGGDGYDDDVFSDYRRRQLAAAGGGGTATECPLTDEYVACMNDTLNDWVAAGGYVPGSDSNLLSVCPAPGQTTHHLPSGAHAFECLDVWTDPETGIEYPYDSFMDPTALHNLHTLIFLTALFHILYVHVYSVVVATVNFRTSQRRSSFFFFNGQEQRRSS